MGSSISRVYDSVLLSNETINWKEELENKRQELVDFVWRGRGIPTLYAPDSIVSISATDVPEFDSFDASNVSGVEQISFTTSSGTPAISWFFKPNFLVKRRCILLHKGHDEDNSIWVRIVQSLIDRGFYVMLCSMPLFDPNSAPFVINSTTLNDHDDFADLHDEPLALRTFLEGAILAKNYVLHYYPSIKTIDMVGLSGGGWTTVMVSALDKQIRFSYSVNGSLPRPLRATNEVGDWEQSQIKDFFKLAEYEDLYALASFPNRKHFMVSNQFDECCFGYGGQGDSEHGAGNREAQFLVYAAGVQTKLEGFQMGSFSFVENPGAVSHTIYDSTLEQIDDQCS